MRNMKTQNEILDSVHLIILNFVAVIYDALKYYVCHMA